MNPTPPHPQQNHSLQTQQGTQYQTRTLHTSSTTPENRNIPKAPERTLSASDRFKAAASSIRNSPSTIGGTPSRQPPREIPTYDSQSNDFDSSDSYHDSSDTDFVYQPGPNTPREPNPQRTISLRSSQAESSDPSTSRTQTHQERSPHNTQVALPLLPDSHRANPAPTSTNLSPTPQPKVENVQPSSGNVLDIPPELVAELALSEDLLAELMEEDRRVRQQLENQRLSEEFIQQLQREEGFVVVDHAPATRGTGRRGRGRGRGAAAARQPAAPRQPAARPTVRTKQPARVVARVPLQPPPDRPQPFYIVPHPVDFDSDEEEEEDEDERYYRRLEDHHRFQRYMENEGEEEEEEEESDRGFVFGHLAQYQNLFYQLHPAMPQLAPRPPVPDPGFTADGWNVDEMTEEQLRNLDTIDRQWDSNAIQRVAGAFTVAQIAKVKSGKVTPKHLVTKPSGEVESLFGTCSICITPISIDDTCTIIKKCDHAFHTECIKPWFKTKKNCPVCRGLISSLATGTKAP
ncbi:hypothetical protein BLNAU_658 [Blattamonas nauphoetae]|uniref:RING-type domain-containing protein n=1 Tax=Blattamonas nauphoetae TaxID=2049346 RepID=A0ABQ9YK39_9EUKA|nr:hypothetical protein BLNAU_658 [Blattamonas nauphoetae]